MYGMHEFWQEVSSSSDAHNGSLTGFPPRASTGVLGGTGACAWHVSAPGDPRAVGYDSVPAWTLDAGLAFVVPVQPPLHGALQFSQIEKPSRLLSHSEAQTISGVLRPSTSGTVLG